MEPYSRLLLAAPMGFLVAVAASAAFVVPYNRWLAMFHESHLKKAVALSLLPTGTILGLAVAWRLSVAHPSPLEWAWWGTCSLLGAIVVARAAILNRRRARWNRASRLRALPASPQGIPWDDLAWWQRLLLVPAGPFNQVVRLRLRRRRVPVRGLDPAFEGYRIVHLTDLHVHRTLSTEWYRHVLRQALAQRPDLILFGGDFLSKLPWVDRVPRVLAGLTAPDGVWYVRGNHDFWKSPQRLRRHARRMGWRLLHNEGTVIRRGGGELALIGLESPYVGVVATDRERLARLPAARVGLVHDPVAFPEAARAGCSVALAGHTHGGQVQLPLFGPTITGTRAPAAHAAGESRLGAMVSITSNGQGAFFPIRFGAPPEIVLLELTRAREERAGPRSR